MFDFSNKQEPRSKVICNDGFTMSAQASVNHYCEPRVNGMDIKYSNIEVGFPSEKEELLMPYIEDEDDPTGTVYAYVPASVIKSVVEKHGGVSSGEMPKLDLTDDKLDEDNKDIEQKISNSIMIISPYQLIVGGRRTWCFDDELAGLKREPFVAGMSEMIDMALISKNKQASDIDESTKNGFTLMFSSKPFVGYDFSIDFIESEFEGSWYEWKDKNMKGWLCPALFKYFDKAPEEIFIKIEV